MHASVWQFASSPVKPAAGSRSAGARRAAGLGLLALFLALLLLTMALPVSAGRFPAGSYPQTLTVEHGWIDATAAQLAAFDLMQIPWWNADGDQGAVLDSARVMHPDIVCMAYANPLGLGILSSDDPDHIISRFMVGVDQVWYARNEFGESLEFELWPGTTIMNLTSKCPRVGGRTWGEYMADFAAQDIMTTGQFDGVHWDNTWERLAWINDYIEGSLDLDNNGVADHPDSVDVWWELGVTHMLQRFRDQVGYVVLADGNGDGPFYSQLNGRFYEAFPRGGWSENMMQADLWQQHGLDPSLLLFATRGEINDYRTMRFGLCSALQVGGVFWHEPPVTPFFNMTIYDEFQVELGRPLGPRQEIGFELVTSLDMEAGFPPEMRQECGYGRSWITEDPALVVNGTRSLVGSVGETPRTYYTYACTDPARLPLEAGGTYTLDLDYRVVEATPPDGYFYLGYGAPSPGHTAMHNLTGAEAGATGHIRVSFTLGPWHDYYVTFGLKDGGTIVIDDIRLTTGQGGVFRRDFDLGLALVNPTDEAQTVDLGGVYYRFTGFQDPITNNGGEVTTVTLAAQDGLILQYVAGGGPAAGVENPPGEPDPGGTGDPGTSSPPLTMVPTVFPNPARISTAPAVTFAGVPTAGVVQIFTVDGRMVRQLEQIAVNGRVGWDLRTSHARTVAPGLYVAVVRDQRRTPVKTIRFALRR